MSVYVDELRRWAPRSRRTTCHMTADSVQELRAFAQAIGLPQSARHYGARVPHYDLNETQRNAALAAGAAYVPAREQARARIEARS